MTAPVVRDATPGDLEAVCAIYAEDVLGGTGTFEMVPPDLTEMTRRHASVVALGLPWLVAEVDGPNGEKTVGAYAYAAPFRLRAAYRYTVEDSVYVASAFQGQGLGRALLQALIARCEAMGLRQMLGVIGDSANAGSIALHTACGFTPVGIMAAVGWKHDDWRDVVIMQRPLGAGGETRPEAAGMALD